MLFIFKDVGHWTIERNGIVREQLLKEVYNKGFIREPLLHIEPSQCLPDLLHIMKGVIGKCLKQVK